MIIYLDESGDLGFDFNGKNPSQKFVITLLVCDGQEVSRGLKKAIRRTIKNKLNKKKTNRRVVQELKGTQTTITVKKYFFGQCPDDGWRIYTIALNKKRVNGNLQSAVGKKKLYNFLARILLQQVDLAAPANAVTLVIDKSKNKDEIADFNDYVSNQLEALLPLDVPLNIYHERSHENTGLQAVDLFCWGIFRKYEQEDVQWYREFGAKIAYETEYLP
ncbi:DUF3800 domain-containing protein [Thermodesulfobacteriota bacterium]